MAKNILLENKIPFKDTKRPFNYVLRTLIKTNMYKQINYYINSILLKKFEKFSLP